MPSTLCQPPRDLRSPRTFSQSLCTSTSASCLHVIRLSIHPSRVGMDAGSVAGDNLDGSGALPTSSILVSMMSLLRCGAQGCECYGGELENDNHAVKSSRQGWSVCNKQRASKEFLDWASKRGDNSLVCARVSQRILCCKQGVDVWVGAAV